jgi:hypothetical protein
MDWERLLQHDNVLHLIPRDKCEWKMVMFAPAYPCDSESDTECVCP